MLGLGKFWKETLTLRFFGWWKIPLLAISSPTIVDHSPECTIVRIPLNWRTRNHLRCMYFGTLAIGADTVVALVAIGAIKKSGKRIDLLFKDFKADFKRRAEGDVHFICNESKEIEKLVHRAQSSAVRVEQKISVQAIVPSINPNEIVAQFELTLSLKMRG